MLEIEAKYQVSDLGGLEVRLLNWGARFLAERHDADHYFNAPDRDFAQTDEAFRVRRIGDRTFLTWKGPKFDQETKTRQEIEVEVISGARAAADLQNLVQNLGYRPVAVVRKNRRVFAGQRDGLELQFCLDLVEGVGPFAEIEIMAEEAGFEPAKAVLQRTAAELGLDRMERRSYLQLLLGAGSAE